MIMELQELIDYCASKKSAVKDFPFDNHTLVFKVMGKMFALVSLDKDPPGVNLKCNPVYAISLRQKYNSVTAGYHMDKNHWNTILLNGDVPDEEIKEWIDDSYNLVVKKLTKAQREAL